MGKVLCIYCTRTGLTRELMRDIAGEMRADIVRVTDGRNYAGVIGYVIAAVKGLCKTSPKLKAFQTRRPLNEYEHIVIGMPIWSEDVCPLARSLVKQIGAVYEGDVSFVVTHMSNLSYEKASDGLDRYLKKPHRFTLSVSTKKDDLEAAVKEFVKNFEM